MPLQLRLLRCAVRLGVPAVDAASGGHGGGAGDEVPSVPRLPRLRWEPGVGLLGLGLA